MSTALQSSKKLKILYISGDCFPPDRVDVATLFGEEITSRGHKIDWILQSNKECRSSYITQWYGGTVWVGRTDNGNSRLARFRKHWFGIIHHLKMFKLARQNSYNFIQVKNKFIAALFAILTSKFYRTKFIFWLSFPFPEESLYKVKIGVARYPIIYFLRGHILKFLLYKIIMPSADHVFVQSLQMKKDVIREGIKESKLTPVPMGFSLKLFEKLRKPSARHNLEVNSKYKPIVYLGTIDQARRINFLIEVLNLVLKKEPDAILYIVGDGEDPKDREILENEAQSLKIFDSMVITGFLPRNEAMEYVKKADVCVSPYFPSYILNSTSPTKLVEYMAMEKPVVVNEHPEQRLMIEESAGGICVPFEKVAFAEAILELLREPEKARAMGIRGRQYVEKYRDYVKIADSLENSYINICFG